MPDYITRKRLKKKALERWENEGGMIPTDQSGAHENSMSREHESELNHMQPSHDGSTMSAPTTTLKKRKPTQK